MSKTNCERARSQFQIIETQIEVTEVIQIAFAERTAVFRHQLFCQGLNQTSIILSTGFPMLLFFHDPPPDVPIASR